MGHPTLQKSVAGLTGPAHYYQILVVITVAAVCWHRPIQLTRAVMPGFWGWRMARTSA